jgi:hypothetical protein
MYIPPNPKLFLILKMTGRNRGSVAIFASHCPALQITRPRLDSVQADPPPPSPRFYTHGQPTSPGSWTNAQRPAKRPTWAADSMRVWGDWSRYPCTRWDANWKGEATELRSVETNLGEERRRGSTKQEKRGAYQTDLHHLDVATAKVVKSVFLSQCYLYKITGSCCLGGCSIYMKGSLQLKDNNEQ